MIILIEIQGLLQAVTKCYYSLYIAGSFGGTMRYLAGFCGNFMKNLYKTTFKVMIFKIYNTFRKVFNLSYLWLVGSWNGAIKERSIRETLIEWFQRAPGSG